MQLLMAMLFERLSHSELHDAISYPPFSLMDLQLKRPLFLMPYAPYAIQRNSQVASSSARLLLHAVAGRDLVGPAVSESLCCRSQHAFVVAKDRQRPDTASVRLHRVFDRLLFADWLSR